MPDVIRQALALFEAHPVHALLGACAVILYAQLMLAGPRVY